MDEVEIKKNLNRYFFQVKNKKDMIETDTHFKLKRNCWTPLRKSESAKTSLTNNFKNNGNATQSPLTKWSTSNILHKKRIEVPQQDDTQL